MKTKGQQMNRRKFISTSAIIAAGISVLPRYVLGGPKFVAPSDKINIAIIGAGGQGRTNMRELIKHDDAQIIAVCDPCDEADYSRFYYQGVAGRRPVKAEIEKHYTKNNSNFKCLEFEDFRVMFDKQKDIDAVLIATPDHVHAVATITAMRLGKHVYCEKPLTHNIWEARQVLKVAKETGVATQMGNQGHSGEGIRQTVELIKAGAIGQIKEVHAWSDAGRWAKHPGRPTGDFKIPAGFNWDLWLGPREYRAYHPDYAPYNWRGFWAFGTGALGDMGCHNLDPAFWALELDAPLMVEATAPGVDSETTTYCTIYRYTYGPRGDLPPVKVTWYDGGLRPPRPDGLDPEIPLGEGGNGIVFIGEKGIISCGGWGGAPRLLPQDKFKDYKKPDPVLPRSKGHHRDWLDAIKGGNKASSSFEYGARLTEMVLLGNVALRVGMPIYWDHENMKAKNAPEADQYIKETYRNGWEIV